MKRGRQRAHANWPRSSCGICICGKRKLVLPNFFCSWRKVGPPPSSRQYQSAKTITFVSQSSPPERKSCNGASRCEGSARTSRITDPISAVVVIPLIMMPRARLSERFPARWLTTVGPSSILTFDQREFHDAVLKNGALPLEILEEQVNKYIRQKKT